MKVPGYPVRKVGQPANHKPQTTNHAQSSGLISKPSQPKGSLTNENGLEIYLTARSFLERSVEDRNKKFSVSEDLLAELKHFSMFIKVISFLFMII
jgi:hypothetical protein